MQEHAISGLRWLEERAAPQTRQDLSPLSPDEKAGDVSIAGRN